MTDEYTHGVEAYESGIEICDNPHNHEHSRRLWARGWWDCSLGKTSRDRITATKADVLELAMRAYEAEDAYIKRFPALYKDAGQ
jgi:hypothetical protein